MRSFQKREEEEEESVNPPWYVVFRRSESGTETLCVLFTNSLCSPNETLLYGEKPESADTLNKVRGWRWSLPHHPQKSYITVT